MILRCSFFPHFFSLWFFAVSSRKFFSLLVKRNTRSDHLCCLYNNKQKAHLEDGCFSYIHLECVYSLETFTSSGVVENCGTYLIDKNESGLTVCRLVSECEHPCSDSNLGEGRGGEFLLLKRRKGRVKLISFCICR